MAGVGPSADTPSGEEVPGALTTNAGRHAATVAVTTTPSVPIWRSTPASISARTPARVSSSWLAVRLISATRACSSRCSVF